MTTDSTTKPEGATMTPTPEEQAYERGKVAGRMETRVGTLENDRNNMVDRQDKSDALMNSLVVTVKLMDQGIINRAEQEERNQELRDQNTKDIAKAVKDVVDATALAATNAREQLAQSLLNKNVETTTIWTPRMGWINFAVLIVAIGGFAYKLFHG